jgi:hypothetical protein
MQWQIGLAGDCLFSGGRLGNGSRLRFGKRFPWDFLADEPCADSTRRLYVLRTLCGQAEGAKGQERFDCSAGVGADERAWQSYFAAIPLLVGSWRRRAISQRNSSTLKGLQAKIPAVFTTEGIKLQIFVNRPIYKNLQSVNLVTSHLAKCKTSILTSAS